MKKMKWAVLLLLALVLLGTGAGAGGNVIEGDINKTAGSLEIGRGTTVNGNVTLNMGEIEILGTVNGDVDSNMGQVTVHGEVNGDVEANMGQVIIVGSVSGNVVARMGEVIVEGSVGRNVKAELGAVRIRGSVGGDVDSGLGELRIPGEVLGNVTSKGKNVIITGTVRGDIDLDRGIVELGPESEVGGRIYVGKGMVKAAGSARRGAVVVEEELSEAEIERLFGSRGYRFHGLDDFGDLGEILDQVFDGIGRAFSNIKLSPGNWRIIPPVSWLGWRGHVARGMLNMVVLFAISALTFALFPRHVQSAGESLISRPGPVVGWGLLALVLAAPLAVLLAITLIGIPLIFVEMLALALAAILGYTALSRFVGEKVAGAVSTGMVNPMGAIALGVLILGAISMVPLAGSLFSMMLFILAVGAALATRFGTLPMAAPSGGAAAPPPGAAAGPAVETDKGLLPAGHREEDKEMTEGREEEKGEGGEG